MTFATPNDTPELNALKALFGAPISMGRGENPVELLPAADCLSFYFKSQEFVKALAPHYNSDCHYSAVF